MIKSSLDFKNYFRWIILFIEILINLITISYPSLRLRLRRLLKIPFIKKSPV